MNQLTSNRFRWVVCQLDILRRLSIVADIRSALTRLPKTLDETYERVLCNIPPESQDMSHKTLQLIATGYITTLAQIVDLLTIDLEKLSFDVENRPRRPR